MNLGVPEEHWFCRPTAHRAWTTMRSAGPLIAPAPATVGADSMGVTPAINAIAQRAQRIAIWRRPDDTHAGGRRGAGLIPDDLSVDLRSSSIREEAMNEGTRRAMTAGPDRSEVEEWKVNALIGAKRVVFCPGCGMADLNFNPLMFDSSESPFNPTFDVICHACDWSGDISPDLEVTS